MCLCRTADWQFARWLRSCGGCAIGIWEVMHREVTGSPGDAGDAREPKSPSCTSSCCGKLLWGEWRRFESDTKDFALLYRRRHRCVRCAFWCFDLLSLWQSLWPQIQRSFLCSPARNCIGSRGIWGFGGCLRDLEESSDWDNLQPTKGQRHQHHGSGCQNSWRSLQLAVLALWGRPRPPHIRKECSGRPRLLGECSKGCLSSMLRLRKLSRSPSDLWRLWEKLPFSSEESLHRREEHRIRSLRDLLHRLPWALSLFLEARSNSLFWVYTMCTPSTFLQICADFQIFRLSDYLILLRAAEVQKWTISWFTPEHSRLALPSFKQIKKVRSMRLHHSTCCVIWYLFHPSSSCASFSELWNLVIFLIVLGPWRFLSYMHFRKHVVWFRENFGSQSNSSVQVLQCLRASCFKAALRLQPAAVFVVPKVIQSAVPNSVSSIWGQYCIIVTLCCVHVNWP